MTASCRCPSRLSKTLTLIEVCSVPQKNFRFHRLRDHRRHVGVSHRRGPGLGPVDQALLQAVQGLLPGDRHRVEVQELHGDAAQLGSRDPVLGAEQRLQLGDRGLLLPAEAHLQAAQLTVGEEELQTVPLLQGLAQDLHAGRAVEEVVLRRPGREDVGVVQHVEVGRAAGRVLGRGGIDVDDAQLGLLHAGELPADLIVADELHADLTVGALFQIASELQGAGALDQEVAGVEPGSTELQRVLRLFAEALLVGRFRRFGERRETDGTAKPAGRQERRRNPVLARELDQIAARDAPELFRNFHRVPPICVKIEPCSLKKAHYYGFGKREISFREEKSKWLS